MTQPISKRDVCGILSDIRFTSQINANRLRAYNNTIREYMKNNLQSSVPRPKYEIGEIVSTFGEWDYTLWQAVITSRVFEDGEWHYYYKTKFGDEPYPRTDYHFFNDKELREKFDILEVYKKQRKLRQKNSYPIYWEVLL